MHETYEIRQSAIERGEWEVWHKSPAYFISRHESHIEAQDECDRMNILTTIPKSVGGNHNELI
jgi:hypothetical protein